MRQRARYSSSVHERERLERLRLVHGRDGESNLGVVEVGELSASRAIVEVEKEMIEIERVCLMSEKCV
jgi:hypothetical protein